MRRKRRLLAIATTAVCLAAITPAASATPSGSEPGFTPGAPGVGDPYFPLEGNGGYDAQHYDIGFSYDPATHRLDGTTAVTARALQNLSRMQRGRRTEAKDIQLFGFQHLI